MFQHNNAPTRTALLSETQHFQSRGASRGSTNGQSASRSLASLENGRASSQGSSGLENRLVNGNAEHVTLSETNDNTFKPQNVSRARTENHQALAHRPRASMIRSMTNYEPEHISTTKDISMEEHGELRHGWEDEYNSSEFLGQLNSVYLHIAPTNSTESGWLMLSKGFLHVLHR